MNTPNNITCPNCNHKFDISDSLSKSVKKKFEVEYEKKLADERLKLKKQLNIEKSEEIKSYQEQLDLKIEEVKGLNKLKADFQKVTREKLELKEKLEAEMEEKLSTQLNEAKVKIKDEVQNKSVMKIAEKDLLIKQLKDQLQIVQTKIEQGSMQAQGEAQEVVMEEFLSVSFPGDIIEEIKKGARGGDMLHIVLNTIKQQCGSIYYESKRTKDFQMGWLEKFKKDMRERKATFGVLVTDCMPKDMDGLGQKNGIWICTYKEFKGLCFVLRESLILLHQATTSQENKGGKMELLYQYLTGTEFKSHIEAIVEGFSQMNTDLDRERRAMEGLWKQREKQLQKVIINTSHLYHSVKGIAGNAVGPITQLNLIEGKK